MCKGYKFTFLSAKLREIGFDVETVLCSTEATGVRPGEFSTQEIETLKELHNTHIMSIKAMRSYVKKKSFKYFVVGTYSGDLQDIIKSARSNGATIIEIATLGFNDPIEHHADINLLISKLGFKAALDKRHGRAKKAKNRVYIGALLADDIPNTYTSDLRSVEDFRHKYSIEQDRLFLWMPGRDDLKNFVFQEKMVSKVKSFASILVKPHPWSYKLQPDVVKKVSRYMTVVDARDAYWALKAMDASVSVNSTAGIEMAVFRKPSIYLKHVSRRDYINKKVGTVGFVAKSEKEMFSIMRSGNLYIPDTKYDEHLNKVYPSPFKPAHQRICDFFRSKL